MVAINNKNPGYTIGKLAEKAGVNIETIRYYQRVGLIHEPEKPLQGFRRYPESVITQLHFIKRAQQLGFTLQEVGELLALGENQGKGNCCDVRQRAEQKRDKVQKQIDDLMAIRATLDHLIKQCHSGSDSKACPLVETLSA